MSTTTWAGHEKELAAVEIPQKQAVPANTEAPDMSPFAMKVVVITLLVGTVFLATLGAWVWYAAYQYQNIGGH